MTRTPAKPHSRAVEDYIKAIYKLGLAGEKATTNALAERLSLGRGTVSGMLTQLAAKGLVEHRPYYGVQLTPAGDQLATRIIRRHRLIELFLVQTLGLGWDEVDGDAEQLEHAVSNRLIDRIDELLGRPEIDPHGAPIPSPDGQMAQQDFTPLIDLKPGTACRVRRVPDGNPKLLQHLSQQGLALNAKVRIVSADPFGVVHLSVGRRNVHLTSDIARQIHVVADP